MQRAGGVRRHELHDHLAVRTARVAAEGIAEFMDLPHHLRLRIAGQEEVDEARARDLHFQHLRRGRQGPDDRFGQVARLEAGGLRQAHGDVGREVPVGRIARAFDDEGGGIDGGRQQRTGQASQGFQQQLLERLLQGGSSRTARGGGRGDASVPAAGARKRPRRPRRRAVR